jgi:glycosyltransferase involved in cell wall biosynthesis
MAAVGSVDPAPFTAGGFPYYRYSWKRDFRPLAEARSFIELYRLFRRHRPDLMHAFNTKPAIFAPLAARRAGIERTVRTITGMGYLFSSDSSLLASLRPVYRAFQRLASGATRVTVFQNDEDREYFLRHGLVPAGSEAVIRGSGVDLREFQAAGRDRRAVELLRRELGLEDRPVVTMVARLLKHKGVREYLAAAAEVRRQGGQATFLLAGRPHAEGFKGVPVEEVRSRSADVHYLGERNDIPNLMAASDIIVLPTYYREGIPRALLEAGSAGLPVITTDMPGCRDVVRDGWNGLLTPVRDVRALASAILRLLAAPDERRTMGERSRTHIEENFSLERIAAAHARLYEDLLTRD